MDAVTTVRCYVAANSVVIGPKCHNARMSVYEGVAADDRVVGT